jgi:HYDIN/CFA65/VesB family protein/ASPM-SPD-2-Hydin domain-containing protein/putative pyrroloquinoline-quinone-binding quinoprotein
MRRILSALAIAIAIAVMLALAASAAASGVTNSGDDLRTGWYPEASTITPQLVSGGSFGRLWSAPVEGQVYAQPLLANGTLLVATEADKAYGLNPTTGAVKWSKTLGTPWQAADIGCGDLTPTIGVTSTPVVDETTGVAYMTHKTYASGNSGPAKWFMDAIEMASGAERPGFPVELAGTAQNEPGESFSPTTELQRPGLLLMEGVVYAAFGSDCDIQPYQGWIFGVSTGGEVKARWSAQTSGSGAGIWQSGAGLTSDGPGTILLSTGNGGIPRSPTPGNSPPGGLGEAVVRVRVQGDGSLKATDFFAPYDAAALTEWDADFASGGVTGLPSEYFGTASLPHLAVAVGKDGYVYLLNRDNLGGIAEGPSGSDNVVQRIGPYGGVWSRPGVWPGEGGWVYIPTASGGNSSSGSAGNLRVYKYGLSGTGSPTLSLAATSPDAFGFSSSAPVITSEGTTSGSALVWVVWAPNGSGVGAQLRAYDPIPVDGQPVLRWSAPVGTSTKFALPGVGAGRLYVGARDGHVLAFGSPVTPVLSGPATSFPTTTVGESKEKTVTLTATEPLTVTALSSNSSQFVRGETAPALPATLTTGQTIHVPIKFAPTSTGTLAATLTATTSSGKTATFSLSGSGQAASALLEATPTVLTFEGTSVGTSRSAGATFRNVGGQPLTIESVDSPAAPFSLQGAPSAGHQLAPGEGLTITVVFEPSVVGTYEDELTLETSAGAQTVKLVAGAGTPGHLRIEPESLSFGSVALGASNERSFTVTNTGGSSVTINKSKPPSGAEFSGTTSLPEGTTVGPGESLTEHIEFAPTAEGAAAGVWLITGDDSTGLHEVKAGGTGVAATTPGKLDVEEGPIEFGTVSLGASSERSVDVTNVGGSAVQISESVPPSGGEFSATTSLVVGTTIAAGQSVVEHVKFAPTSSGAATGEWRITGDDSTGQHKAHFSGTGASAATPGKLEVEEQRLDFGSVLLGAHSERSFAVANVGSSNVEITESVPPSGGSFAASSSLAVGTVLQVGQRITEHVKFAPTASGVATGEWRITGSDASGSHAATFSGTGVAPTPTPMPAPPTSPLTVTSPLLQPLPEQSVRGTFDSVQPAPAPSRARITSRRLNATRAGSLAVSLGCESTGTRCTGVLTLRTASAVRGAASTSGSRRAVLTLAKASFSVAGGHTGSVHLRLSREALTLLARTGTLSTRASLAPSGKAATLARASALLPLRLAAPSH